MDIDKKLVSSTYYFVVQTSQVELNWKWNYNNPKSSSPVSSLPHGKKFMKNSYTPSEYHFNNRVIFLNSIINFILNSTTYIITQDYMLHFH